jgi:hypothetical protein
MGTTRKAVTMKVSVRRAKVPGAHGTTGSRAWVPVTRAYLPPMQKTKHGVLAVRVPTRCG